MNTFILATVIIIIIIVIIIIGGVYVPRENPQVKLLTGNPKIIIGEKDEKTWYENIIRHLLPNGDFVRASRLSARDEDIVILSWGTIWDKKPFGTKGYRIFIDAEPFNLDDTIADLIITTRRLSIENSKSIYLPYYAMSILEPKINTVDELLLPPSNIERYKFCIFVHSNCNHEFAGVRYREKFFDVLESISGEKIDSPGKCKNNMILDIQEPLALINTSSEIVDNSKWRVNMDLFKSYKFVMAIENDFIDGYITEKLINPLLGGAIPIYLGSPDVIEHFNSKRFINVRDFPDMESCARYIVEVHNNPELYKQIQSAPIFNDSSNIELNCEETIPRITYKSTIKSNIVTNPYLLWTQTGILYPELSQKISSKIKPYLSLLSDLTELEGIPLYELEDINTFHYINLDRSKERNQSIIKQAGKYNLPIKRIEAYNGQLLNRTTTMYMDKFSVQLQIDPERGELLPGEIGCYLSHISFWLSALRNDMDYICIIEDDVNFTDALASFKFPRNLQVSRNFTTEMTIREIIETAPRDWDILYLGYNAELCQNLSESKKDWTRAIRKYQPCTLGYIINRRTMWYLLKNSWPISIPIDEFIRKYFDSINAYIRVPPLITSNTNLNSTIR